MFVSSARLEANRRNAQKSTGPKTERGKQASRRNALTHGLTAGTVAAEDPALQQARSLAFSQGNRPDSAWVAWLADEVATITLRLDLVKEMDRHQRGLAALRAATTWDDDCRVEVARIGARLATDPTQVVAQLRQTPHGCDWLIGRWQAVADLTSRFISQPGEWRTSDQRQLLDLLLGKPFPTEPGMATEKQPDPWYRSPHAVRTAAELARGAIAELQTQRQRVQAADDAQRALIEAGLGGDSTPELRRIRRYEAALYKRLDWCQHQAREQDQTSTPATAPGLTLIPKPSPPAVIPVPHEPEPSLAQDRIDTPADSRIERPATGDLSPPTLEFPPRSLRLAARLQQADQRRARKHRKLERRRG